MTFKPVLTHAIIWCCWHWLLWWIWWIDSSSL